VVLLELQRGEKKSLLARGSVRRSRQGGICKCMYIALMYCNYYLCILVDSPIIARRGIPRKGSSGLLKFSSPTQASISRRNSYQGSSIAQLTEELKTSTSIADKADVLHYMYTTL